MGRNRTSGWLVLMVYLLLLSGCGQEPNAPKKPGEAEFREANRRIIRLEGKATMGNCPQAEQLAAHFAKAITELRAQTIEKGHENRLSLSKGQMLVFCELTETHCAFMVHVPELRKFTREAKDVMTAICWQSAQTILRAQGIKRDHLAVGVKGVMLYEAVLVGKTVDDASDSDDGIEERTDEMASLYPYFLGNPPSATAAPIASTTPATPATAAPARAQSTAHPVAQAPEVKPSAPADSVSPAPAAKPATPAPAVRPPRPLEGFLSAEFGKPTSPARGTMVKYPWTNPRDQMYRLYNGDMWLYEFGDLTVRAIYSTDKKPILYSVTATRKLTADEIESAKRAVLKEDPRGRFDAIVEKDGTLLTLVPER